MDEPRSDRAGGASLEPGRPRTEHAIFVLLGALGALLALSQMFAFL